MCSKSLVDYIFFQAEDGIRDYKVTGVQTCALPISNVQVKSSSGNIALKGTMANYQDLKAATYNMQVQTQQVQAGAILKRSEERRVGKEWRIGLAKCVERG